MRGNRGYHVLFGVSLLCLGALGAWWFVNFIRFVDLERTDKINHLRHMAVVTALTLGHRAEPPALIDALPQQPSLAIVRADDTHDQTLHFRVVPNHTDYAIRINDAAVALIDEKLARRRFMFIGEGSLLFLLIGIGTVMLYRLVRAERRHVRRMEAFLGAVTHEMKTPLTGIQTLLQTLAAGRVPKDDEQRLLAMGLKETERLEHMVENILVSGRLRTQRQIIRAEPTALRPFLAGFVKHRERYLMEGTGTLRFVWEPGTDDLKVVCDPAALHTVLENLTDNAFKYGGDNPEVTIRAQAADGRASVSVEDTGIGFAPESAEQLFVPFRRALDERHAAQHGTGLGLAIARALARRMGGTLKAASDGPGKGARFTIDLAEAKES